MPSKLQKTLGQGETHDLYNEKMLFLSMQFFRRELGKKSHIKKYQKIKRLQGEILGSMLDYYDDGKFEPTISTDIDFQHIKQSKINDTITITNCEFNLETREGMHGFQNMMIYKNSPYTNCITEEFIKCNRFRKPEKINFLHSMMNSRQGLFEITKTSQEGYVYLKEVFTNCKYKIIDVGLSINRNLKDIYIYTRIITHDGISLSSGLGLIFFKTDPFIQNFIKQQKKDYDPLGELRRFVTLYNHFSKDSGKVKIVANTY